MKKKITLKSKILLLLVLIVSGGFFVSCAEKNVKILEEKDPLNKKIEEKDSIRVIKTDSLKKAYNTSKQANPTK